MNNVKTIVRSAVVAGFGLAVSALPLAAEIEPVNLRLAHVVNEQDGFHAAATKFKELVGERSDGAISVEISPTRHWAMSARCWKACRSARSIWA